MSAWLWPLVFLAGCALARIDHADGTQVLDSPLNNAFAHFVNLSLYFAGPTVAEAAALLAGRTECPCDATTCRARDGRQTHVGTSGWPRRPARRPAGRGPDL